MERTGVAFRRLSDLAYSRPAAWLQAAMVAMTQSTEDPPPDTPQPAPRHVFECRQCHKVFEARTTRAFCPECDSDDVERLTA